MNLYIKNLIVFPIVSALFFAAIETLFGSTEHLLREAVLTGLCLALVLSLFEAFPALKGRK